MRRRLELALFLVAATVSITGAQSASPTQTPKLSPQEQLTVDAQLSAPKLKPSATVTLDLLGASRQDVVAAIAKASGVTVRYHSAVTLADVVPNAKFSNATAEDALNTVLTPKQLTFQATGSKSVFVYPDTPANRAKYTDSIRSFPIVHADIQALMTTVNQALTPVPADDLRPTVVSVREPRLIFVRATPDVMARVAKIIADNDKK